MGKKYWIYWLAAIFILINIGLSFYFELSKQSNIASSFGDKCLSNSSGLCFKVQNSSYGSLFGISTSVIGIIGFGAILILLLLDLKEHRWHDGRRNEKQELMLSASLTIAAIFALWLIYVQFFVLRTICPYCLVVDSLTLIVFAIHSPRIFKELKRRVND